LTIAYFEKPTWQRPKAARKSPKKVATVT
jgi:hypothetical protein